jgi:hypothetical protein
MPARYFVSAEISSFTENHSFSPLYFKEGEKATGKGKRSGIDIIEQLFYNCDMKYDEGGME